MSESSVSRIFSDLGIKYPFQRPKEKLNQNQKLYRLQFSKEIQKLELFLLQWSHCFGTNEKKKVKIIPLIDNPDYFYEKQ